MKFLFATLLFFVSQLSIAQVVVYADCKLNGSGGRVDEICTYQDGTTESYSYHLVNLVEGFCIYERRQSNFSSVAHFIQVDAGTCEYSHSYAYLEYEEVDQIEKASLSLGQMLLLDNRESYLTEVLSGVGFFRRLTSGNIKEFSSDLAATSMSQIEVYGFSLKGNALEARVGLNSSKWLIRVDLPERTLSQVWRSSD